MFMLFYKYGFQPDSDILKNNRINTNVIKNVALGGSSNTVIRRKTFWYLNQKDWTEKMEFLRR